MQNASQITIVGAILYVNVMMWSCTGRRACCWGVGRVADIFPARQPACQHGSAWVSMGQHGSAWVTIRVSVGGRCLPSPAASLSAWVRMCVCVCVCVCMCMSVRMCVCVCVCVCTTPVEDASLSSHQGARSGTRPLLHARSAP